MKLVTKLASKTFLIGEYAVLNNGCAVVLNTKPVFEMREGKFFDPHNSKGGFGASSAKWIFKHNINTKDINVADIRNKYLDSTWSGVGIAPSGVDVLSQLIGGVFAIDMSNFKYVSTTWNFYDFFIVRTGHKVKTYKHLENLKDVTQFDTLTKLSKRAFELFIKNNQNFFSCLKEFDLELCKLNLCLAESISLRENICAIDGVIYARACGAMGADTMIVFVSTEKFSRVRDSLLNLNLEIIATMDDII